ncbi:hypothetical protein [Ectothiorhodospira variabilis]|uniref:hypothetical protein n=1 Tax=Ectothiorhodospira variabilis TaxID=505694 RepID=UPI001EFBF17A|nr:hypothetical protein [Ectothiorhodospira variabilis]MCG5497503.1 hypothetical protein [Ectothiorhodospira variabilis]
MNELLTAASVLLAITGVLYALWHDDIVNAISMVMPQHKEDRGEFEKKLKSVLLSRAIPLLMATLCIMLVYLPPSIGIILSSFQGYRAFGLEQFQNYDSIATSFVLVEVFTSVLAIQSAVYVWKLLSKLRASKR